MMAKKNGVKRMMDAYKALCGLPGIKEHVEGKEGKIGFLQFKHGKRRINMGWLRGVGIAWMGLETDFDPHILDEILRDGKVSEVTPLQFFSKSAAIMHVVRLLSERRHPVAEEVVCKKAEKARRLAKSLRFNKRAVDYWFGNVWRIHYHISSPRVVVITSAYGCIYAEMPPNTNVYLRHKHENVRLIDVYNALVSRGIGNAFELVADTDEKKAALLTQMLADKHDNA